VNVKPFFLTLFFSFVFLSCMRKDEVPNHILPIPKMAHILLDIHLAESKVNSFRLMTMDSVAALYKTYESRIFQKHKITDSIYKKSYRFYAAHPELLDQVYGIVVDSLSARLTTLRID